MKLKKLLMASSLLLGLAEQALGVSLFPEVTPVVDIERYSGLWYEVASTKPPFQRGCVCVKAQYTILPNGTVQVANSCRRNNVTAEDEVIFGTATPTDHPAKFVVSFGSFSLPFSNYWIVDLAPDYSYAVVSTPLRRPIWVLSRTPSLDTVTLSKIYHRLDQAGFNINRITPTEQNGC